MDKKNYLIRGAIGGIPEQVIAMAVAIVVVAGMIILGAQLFNNVKVKRNVADIAELAANIHNVYESMPMDHRYDKLDCQVLKDNDLIPAALKADGSTAKSCMVNVWGKGIDALAIYSQAFVVVEKVAPDDCKDVVAQMISLPNLLCVNNYCRPEVNDIVPGLYQAQRPISDATNTCPLNAKIDVDLVLLFP